MRRREPPSILGGLPVRFLHRARVEVFAQSVELVGTKELREFVKFPRVVDAQRGAVCRELNQGVEVLPLSELLLCLIVQECVELAPDTSPDDVFCVLVVGAHDAHLSPHPGGVPVLSLRKKTLLNAGWRVSKMRFHDAILLPLK